jgi:hypothetical protein
VRGTSLRRMTRRRKPQLQTVQLPKAQLLRTRRRVAWRTNTRAGSRRLPPVAAPGPTCADLALRGPRVVFGARAVVIGLGAPVGLLVAPSAHWPVAVGLVCVAVVWTAAVFAVAVRCPVALPIPLLVVDALVIAVVCLTQAWTVSPVDLVDGSNWMAVTMIVTISAYPWRVGPAAAAVMAVGLLCAAVIPPVAIGLVSAAAAMSLGLWGLGVAALSGIQHHLIDRAAGLVDEASRRVEGGRRAAAVAKARADDERDHLAALHDTAATTLLLVGQGMLTSQRWLAEQAARDLEILRGPGPGQSGTVDLLGLLRSTCEASHLAVDVQVDALAGPRAPRGPAVGRPRAVPVPGSVALALCGSTREALGNAARHAGVSSAQVAVQVSEGQIVVEIRDRGRGFTPNPGPSRGRGIAESIVGRMGRVGGHAEISTSVGVGTAVRLGWALPSRRGTAWPLVMRPGT